MNDLMRSIKDLYRKVYYAIWPEHEEEELPQESGADMNTFENEVDITPVADDDLPLKNMRQEPVEEPVAVAHKEEISSDTDMAPLPPIGIEESKEEKHAEEEVKCESVVADPRFDKLMQECADIVKKYDSLSMRLDEGEAKTIAEDIAEQLIAVMLRSGGEAIVNEKVYNPIRHQPVPMVLAEVGTPIASTIRVGVADGNKVYVPAKVQLNI
jgi:hypothetical protein